jgi:predicted enzyme related to lactoylglutathione lyase
MDETVLAVEVRESLTEALTAVVERGGEVTKPRTAIVEGADWQAIFRDPAGNAFALYEEAQ